MTRLLMWFWECYQLIHLSCDHEFGLDSHSISMLICSDLWADRQSSKSGGDPAARAHEIQREVKNPGGGEVPQTNETAERPFWDFLASKSGHFWDLRFVSPVNWSKKNYYCKYSYNKLKESLWHIFYMTLAPEKCPSKSWKGVTQTRDLWEGPENKQAASQTSLGSL